MNYFIPSGVKYLNLPPECPCIFIFGTKGRKRLQLLREGKSVAILGARGPER